MQRSRRSGRAGSKKTGLNASAHDSGHGAAIGSRQNDTVSRAIVALHSATDAAGVFAAVRRFLRETMPASFIAFLLHGRERDRETFLRCAGQPRPPDPELRASLRLVDEARRRQRRKALRANVSNAGVDSDRRPSGARAGTHPALLLGFDGCGYARALLLVARSSGNFRPDELELLERLRVHATAALRVVRTLQRERVTRLALQKLLSRFPVGIVVLDWEERTLYRNATAAELCARWNYGGEARSLHASRVFRIPKEVLRACRSLDTANSRAPAEAVVTSPARPTVRAVVQSVRFEVKSLGRPRHLIHFEQISSKRGSHAAPTRMDLLLRLSPRERELAEVVSRGVSNADAARALGKSVYTVKKQLQGVYRKLGVTNRARLTAILAH